MKIKKIIDKHISCANTFLFYRKSQLFFVSEAIGPLLVLKMFGILKVNGNGFITNNEQKLNTASNMINALKI